MSHICLLYTPPDRSFARQLAVQLQQRGLVVAPVPDTATAPGRPPPPPPTDDLPDAGHVIVVMPAEGSEADAALTAWQTALSSGKRSVFAVQRAAGPVPDWIKNRHVIDFTRPFLLAVEDLVKSLEKRDAPTRPLTVEHPPPVVKANLLPIKLSSERCWRDDRLRINYNLPILITIDDLAERLPAFLVQAGFELERTTHKAIRARRLPGQRLFDPRRAQQTLTIQPRKGRLRVYYRMERVQVYYWFPSHYYVLDREAAALYRYLATGRLDGILAPVIRQAHRARRLSWVVIAAAVLVALLLIMVIIL